MSMRIDLMGIPIDCLGFDETLDRISDELRGAEPRLELVRERLNCLKYYDNAIGEATTAL